MVFNKGSAYPVSRVFKVTELTISWIAFCSNQHSQSIHRQCRRTYHGEIAPVRPTQHPSAVLYSQPWSPTYHNGCHTAVAHGKPLSGNSAQYACPMWLIESHIAMMIFSSGANGEPRRAHHPFTESPCDIVIGISRVQAVIPSDEPQYLTRLIPWKSYEWCIGSHWPTGGLPHCRLFSTTG
jgi:hypothetical protein